MILFDFCSDSTDTSYGILKRKACMSNSSLRKRTTFGLMLILFTAMIVTPNAVAQGAFPHVSATALKTMEGDGKEIAIIDPREEGVFGEAHLLYAVNLPLSKLELNIFRMIPRKSTRIVLTDGGEGTSERAAVKLNEFGYGNVAILDGGYPAWKKAGYEIFSGMSVEGKAFGEWITVHYQTPTMTPEQVQERISKGEKVLILDSRPSNEYVNMNIPGSINVPVSELVFRFFQLGVSPDTLVVVNCAGRTRSLIGAQTLINAGIPNKVAAMRGGTMAWQMAGLPLEHGTTRHAPEPWGANLQKAMQTAQKVADRYGVKVISAKQLDAYKADQDRSLYIIDLRTPDEYRAGHRSDSTYGWGVQLVQGMDKYAATHKARVVLIDNYMVRALMTASWMVQADWPETYVLADPFEGVSLDTGDYKPLVPGSEQVSLPRIKASELNTQLQAKKTTVIDVADSLSYKKGHIPGAWFAIRSRLDEALRKIPQSSNLVVTGDDSALVALTARDLAKISGRPVSILEGGNTAWRKASLPVTPGFENLATKTDDIFLQPFLWGQFEPMSPEFKQAANAYFEWELQLPGRLERAKETNFKVISLEDRK
jgi:rhodanese-related sulfurtransferase